LNILKRQYPKVPLLGLTATATVRVLRDVQDMLGIQGAIVFRAPFNRANLFYEVHHKAATGGEAMNALADMIRHRFDEKSGIVYCLSVKDTEEVARDLVQRGIKARCYHAQLTPEVRSRTHHDWLRNKIFVVVATVAFGMGIDKPDVRFVIHHTLSKSIETFYQESGRAGRDGQTAYCILFYRMQDIFRLSSLTYHEKVGESNLRGMVAYAHNISTCRRTPLAQHFGEEWTQTMCLNMCDVCKRNAAPNKNHNNDQNHNNGNTISLDVTQAAIAAIEAVDLGKTKSKSGKCTALQLMEAWIGKRKPKLADLRVATKEDCERILVDLLLNDYLTQIYHSSAYGFVSYLQPSLCGKALLKGKDKYQVVFEVKENGKIAAALPTSPAHEDEDETLNSAYDHFEDFQETCEAFDAERTNPPLIDLEEEEQKDCLIVQEDPLPRLHNERSFLELDYGDIGDSLRKNDFDFSSPSSGKRSIDGASGSGGPKKRRGLF
jgi:ATP-dependent DNA helicase Q1